jgi:DnaJ-domain-containing protein 1
MAGSAYSDNIIDLREVSPDHWQAKYQGNFGVYTIKITTDGTRRGSFSCSCPSDYYPCKHIPVVEEAIAKRIEKNTGAGENGGGLGLRVEELLGRLTHKELFDFTARLVRNDPDLTSAVFLAFSDKIEHENGNKYLPLIRAELENVRFREEDYDREYDVSIDALDRWAERAEEYLEEGNSGEAALIAQACLEEFARWLDETADADFIDYIPEDYRSRPFEILEKASLEKADGSPRVNAKDLYDYCVSEMTKEKYEDHMRDYFHDLLAKLAAEVDPEAFIRMQEDLLNGVENKSSSEAAQILRRIINCYTNWQKPDKAWSYVEKNMQITSFRKMVIEKRIEEKRFGEAKKLVQDYLDANPDPYRLNDWNDYLLQIAQGEHDVPAVRSVAYSFIKDTFQEPYYRIYQSAFGPSEWPEQFERLLASYEAKKSRWNDSAAKLLAAEGMAERLMEHIGKAPSLDIMEKYYPVFAASFPVETLYLFRNAADRYMEENTGRNHYERIVSVFEKMERIPGGSAVTADMTRFYLARYKNRRAMIEILMQR